jgi:uncharacterized protein (TIGR01777 family)|tara:strand:- start:649 stop:1542 length:894 start_codon:yes stop_codon:yes gene_type:complete
MSERVLITGYNGALAKRVAIILEKKFDLVFLTSNKKSVNNKNIFFWNIEEEYIDPLALKDCKHIIHLCGFNIMNRWSKKNRELMYSSRVLTANLLFKKCFELELKIESFIGASAMGYYGLNTIADVDESAENGSDWLAKLSLDWENAANQFNKIGSRIVNLRISLLMDLNSGFLKVTLLPLKIGITSIFTPADLVYSWIHIDDVAKFILYAIENNHVAGPYNMAVPNRQSQKELIKEIKSCVFPFAIIFPIPIFLMKLFLGGRSQVLSGGLYLKSDKILNSGFNFTYPSVTSFLKNN